MKILVLNVGSSSLKGLLCDVVDASLSRAPAALWDAELDWGRPGSARLRLTANGSSAESELSAKTTDVLFDNVLKTLWQGPQSVIKDPGDIKAVGHRIVHGGKNLRIPTRVDPEVKKEIQRLAEFAPEHNPRELEAIEASERALGPAVPQIAVFDTGFHSSLPAAAATYPGPYEWLDRGIQRYGFHGISYQYALQRAREILGPETDRFRIIACHLGNGCSLAAIQDGHSIDTTMGFTPLEGLMMGSRSGSVDPGIIFHLLESGAETASGLKRVLNEQSGLKGLSGISSDMRDILAAIEKNNPRAKLAFDVYAHRLCREMGGMLASLGGMDVLIFTGGVGENCAPLREIVCRRFGFLGIKVDAEKNGASPVDQDISRSDSTIRVLVIHAEEDWQIARECWRLISEQARKSASRR